MKKMKPSKSILTIGLIGLLVVAGIAAVLFLNKDTGGIRTKVTREPDWASSVEAKEDTASPDPTLIEETSTYVIRSMEPSGTTLQSLGLNMGNFPRLDGATSTQPIRALIACTAFGVEYGWQQTPSNEMFINPTYEGSQTEEWEFARQVSATNAKTHLAYMDLISGKNDLILVSTKPSAEEQQAAKELGVKLELTPIGLDGFVFLVNKSNSIDNLATADIVDIYTGQIDNWQVFTGKDEPIKAFVRPLNSGSQELMDKLVMKDLSIDKTLQQERVIRDMRTLVEGVSNNPYSIGYSLYYYKNTMIDSFVEDKPDDTVKLLSVDGVQPNPKTIASGNYPYVFNIYAVTKSDAPEDSLAHKLKQWLVSEEGQGIVVKAGYVGLGD
ncbi:MAG: PstS family phosphate ABC transporter substrate-binding protein [Candidatus Aquicultorales bacterium]